MTYEETPITKRVVSQLPKPTKEKTDMNKEQFQKAKDSHRGEIDKIKANRKAEKQDIKRHRLLIKQAKIVYRLSKMKGKK